jgi:catechol 2,3-dioxygenase-like lactoylglutathione lyase family enzyme
MLGSRPVTTFVATANADAAREFYEGVLGLTFTGDDGFALLFALPGVQLRVVRTTEFRPHTFTTLGWNVDSMPDAVETLRSRGVTFERYSDMDQDDLGIWMPPGSQHGVAWFKDPDGNLLSVSGPV